ncbi:MAG: hypothetical protein O2895_07325 [Chloroflexi bacterium]|nr:hypothetical protein [Chloroflexota bacterium]
MTSYARDRLGDQFGKQLIRSIRELMPSDGKRVINSALPFLPRELGPCLFHRVAGEDSVTC